jgi:hypothetical protein
MPKKGLCKRCNRLRREVDRHRKIVARSSEWDRQNEFGPTRDLRFAEAMVEIAKREGYRFGDIHMETSMAGLSLEYELTLIAHAATGRHLYYNHAGILEQDFSCAEISRIRKLLAPLGRAVMRKNARSLAAEVLTAQDAKGTEGRT